MMGTFDYRTILGIGQLVLDALLLVAVVILYRKFRSIDTGRLDTLADAWEESRRLCGELEKNLREKERISSELRTILEGSGRTGSASTGKDAEARVDDKAHLREKAVSLWQQGLGIQEISRATGLLPGEIEVLISLARRSKDRAA